MKLLREETELDTGHRLCLYRQELANEKEVFGSSELPSPESSCYPSAPSDMSACWDVSTVRAEPSDVSRSFQKGCRKHQTRKATIMGIPLLRPETRVSQTGVEPQ